MNIFKWAMVLIIILCTIECIQIIKDYNKNTTNKYETIKLRIDIIKCLFDIVICVLLICETVSSDILWLILVVKYSKYLIDRKLKYKIDEQNNL